MTDHPHDTRTDGAAARPPAHAGQDGARPCAFPGCPTRTAPPGTPGRPPAFCPDGATHDPAGTGKVFRHDKRGAFEWRRKYGTQTPDEVAAHAEQDPAHEQADRPAQATAAAHAGEPGELSASLARVTATEQARVLGEVVDGLPHRLTAELTGALAPYVEALRTAGNVDAAAQEIAQANRRADQRVLAAEEERDAAEAAARTATEKQHAAVDQLHEANEVTDDALAAADHARDEATRARTAALLALGFAARARDDAAEQQRAHDTELARVRAEAQDQVEAAATAGDERAAAAESAAAAQIEQVRAQATQEIEAVRAEAHEQVEAAQAQARQHELDAERAQQAETDAHADADRVRTQATEDRQRYRDDLADLREQLRTAEQQNRQQWTDHQRTLDELRAGHETERRQRDRDHAQALRAAWNDAHAVFTQQDVDQPNPGPHEEQDQGNVEPSAEDLELVWTEGLPAPLVDALQQVSSHGEQRVSRTTGVRKDQAARLRKIYSGVNGANWTTDQFRRSVLPQVRDVLVDRQLSEKSPQLAADLAHAKDLTRRYLAGDDISEPAATQEDEQR